MACLGPKNCFQLTGWATWAHRFSVVHHQQSLIFIRREQCILRDKGAAGSRMQNKTGTDSSCCGIVWLKCPLRGSVIGYRHENETQKSKSSLCVRWKSIHLCIWITVHIIVRWDGSSFFSKKEAKPLINFYTRLSLMAHLCIGSNKAIARQNIWSIETQG